MNELTQEHLKRLFLYNPESGLFTRLKTTASNAVKGSVAGNRNSRGYVKIKINGREYSAHRLAWLYVYGSFPEAQIDHINQDKSDNRIGNLRKATAPQNQQNVGVRKDNSSGFAGVRWNKQLGKWVANIRVHGIRKHLGCFDDMDAAVQARLNAELLHHTFKSDCELLEEKP